VAVVLTRSSVSPLARSLSPLAAAASEVASRDKSRKPGGRTAESPAYAPNGAIRGGGTPALERAGVGAVADGPRPNEQDGSDPGAVLTQILVVDDEEDLQELVRYNLTKEGYRVSCVGTGEDALRIARRQPPDLIVLDLMLPAVDGLEVCRRLKGDSKTRDIPIIMLTAKSEESDMIAGLERGADDYIAKPFSPRVLAARVKALLRRKESERLADLDVTIEARDLVMHPGRHEATLAGRPLELTYTEFALLQFLAKRPGWAYTRMQIVDAVKGEDYPVTELSVDVQVAGLRKKLGSHGNYIETVRGVGYRFRA
jgi:two-component system alkaline phosphatase synthesis response regulator PhoP